MRAYYRKAHGAILVYDLSDEEGFNKMEWWYEEARKYMPKDALLALVRLLCSLSPSHTGGV